MGRGSGPRPIGPILTGAIRGRTRGAPVASALLGGLGGASATSANPTYERTQGKGDPGLRPEVRAETADKLIERSVWWAIARLATSLQWYFPKGGDAHVEGELARIVCLLPCRFVRQE